MLQWLQVSNLALIESAQLEFDRGFIAVTGETGAGKSVLLGAMSLLAGNRADRSCLRQGAEQCQVEGTIVVRDVATVDAQLEAMGLPPTEDACLVLRRQLHASKPARAFVNGATATLANLQALGGYWIDFHGPGEPQKLFKDACQLELLDLYAKNGDRLIDYREDYRAWQATLAAITTLTQAEQLDADELAFLQGQLQMIERVSLDEAALAQLERDDKRLDKARDINTGAGEIAWGLESNDGVSGTVSELLRKAKALAAMDPDAEALAKRLEGLVIESADLAGDYRSLAEATDFEPAEAEAIQQKMGAWLEVKRKFGPTLDDVRARRDKLQARLGSQGDVTAQLARLEHAAKTQAAQLQQQAGRITEARQASAGKLAKQAEGLLTRLGFKKPRLLIDVIEESDLTAHGLSRCQFRFAPNPGTDPKPLSKIASSGESARVMLALKTVLAGVDATPVLVFDEVDANVGGEIGAEVGRELARLGNAHQVFCITHLPQVAACGQQHWVVTKAQTDATTSVSIEPIHADGEARVAELARMLGDRKAESARAHARELLS